MKYIWLGIKDYCKDCWHDFWYWIWGKLEVFCTRRANRCYCWRYNEGCFTKEGSVWHYIQQRRIAKRINNGRKKPI